MSAYDVFHHAVRAALLKEGWRITHDPLRVQFGTAVLSIDLGAELVIAAERDNAKIAVEVKSFTSDSMLSEFHTALGQYLNYRKALQHQEPDRILYLAAPSETVSKMLENPLVVEQITDFGLRIISYDPEREVIVEWKS